MPYFLALLSFLMTHTACTGALSVCSLEMYGLHCWRKPRDREKTVLSVLASIAFPYANIGDQTHNTAVERQCSTHAANWTAVQHGQVAVGPRSNCTGVRGIYQNTAEAKGWGKLISQMMMTTCLPNNNYYVLNTFFPLKKPVNEANCWFIPHAKEVTKIQRYA